MIVDSSAVMTVLGAESPAPSVLTALAMADRPRMSTATWLEVSIVADRRSPRHGGDLDRLLSLFGICLEPVTAEHARLARIAYRRYGRGTGSPARLNFGDCFSYALAVASGEPLLFVGDDFVHTDVTPASWNHTNRPSPGRA